MQPYPPQQQQQPYPQQVPQPQQQAYPQQQYPQQQPQAGYGYAPQQPRVNPGVLLGVTAWRLLIIAFALIGFFASLEAMDNPWPGLSLHASLVTAIVYSGLLLWPLFTAGRSHEPPSSWLRGATAVMLMVVCIVFLFVMEGDLDETWSLFEHLLTPLIVLIDWVAVGRGAARAKWWHAITWVVFPLIYLIILISSGVAADMYDGMFDPDSDEFAGMLALNVGLTLVLGFVIYGLGKLKGAMAAAAKAQPQHPQWQQPQPQVQQQWPQQPQPQQQWQQPQAQPQQPQAQPPQQWQQ